MQKTICAFIAVGMFSGASVKAQFGDPYAMQRMEMQRQAMIQMEMQRRAAIQMEMQRQAAMRMEMQRQAAIQMEMQRRAAIQAELQRRAYQEAALGISSGHPQSAARASSGVGSGRILAVLAKATDKTFTVTFNPMLNDGAFARPGNIIEINPAVFGRLSKPAQDFLLMHEASHHLLRHQYTMRLSMETEADLNAARLMRDKLDYSRSEIVSAAHEIFFTSPGDATHPRGPVRVAAVDRELAD